MYIILQQAMQQSTFRHYVFKVDFHKAKLYDRAEFIANIEIKPKQVYVKRSQLKRKSDEKDRSKNSISSEFPGTKITSIKIQFGNMHFLRLI